MGYLQQRWLYPRRQFHDLERSKNNDVLTIHCTDFRRFHVISAVSIEKSDIYSNVNYQNLFKEFILNIQHDEFGFEML